VTRQKQIQANKRNAQKSTGPKTPEGKAAVRHNALKHGLLAEHVLVIGEDKDELRALGERMVAKLQPEGELEELLVEQIVAAHWRLQRLHRVEAGVFNHQLASGTTRAFVPGHNQTIVLGESFIRDANGANAFSKLSRYEIPIERSLYRALHELQRLQAARRAEGDVSPPVAVDVDVSGITGENP
jgi:hypothetical protein